MIVAGAVAVALNVLPPPFQLWLSAHPPAARAIFGVAMGVTAISIVYSPWGARSGAHLNPAVTLTFALLGKLRMHDAVGYALAQFVGGVLGFTIVAMLAGTLLTGPPSYAIVTKPGAFGIWAAFAGETTIAFIMMTTVLWISNASPRIARFTGVAAGTLVAIFITFEAPISGMSLNPARTFASALVGHDFTAIWLYFIAPPAGMILAALAFVALRTKRAVLCGRLNHTGPYACIFNCSRNEP
jgi:aquaporin Z